MSVDCTFRNVPHNNRIIDKYYDCIYDIIVTWTVKNIKYNSELGQLLLGVTSPCIGCAALNHCCKWCLFVFSETVPSYYCTMLLILYVIRSKFIGYWTRWIQKCHLVVSGGTSNSLAQQQVQQRHLAKNTASKVHFCKHISKLLTFTHNKIMDIIFFTFYIRRLHNLHLNRSHQNYV